MCMTYTCNLDDAYFCTSVNHCIQASHISCTSFTFRPYLLWLVYMLLSHAYLHTSVSYFTSFVPFRYKFYILHVSVTTCICATISYNHLPGFVSHKRQ